MQKQITSFIPYSDPATIEKTVSSFLASGIVEKAFIMKATGISAGKIKGASFLESEGFFSTAALKSMAVACVTDYVVLYTKSFDLDLGQFALQRMMQVCELTGAGLVYSDYFENKNGNLTPHPVTDYQAGSLRDDFNFGSVILFSGQAFRDACGRMDQNYRFAGLYDLRLIVSRDYPIIHIPEMLYTETETDLRNSGEKQFDYVDPRNRSVQVEMELAFTAHLKKVNSWLKPDFIEVNFESEKFEYEASVIIPVRNRAKTISDAIGSVLGQETGFPFNLIIVDNFSTDGTTEIIRSFAGKDKRMIHIIPSRNDLGIGGCWNEGIFYEKCGKFAIQLDSDDLYIDNNVLARIVQEFYAQRCAMVIGSYKMVNFRLEDIPPGLIDHREWTPENGRNNALRINGLGAPRAFYTPVLREIRVPNVSYGEDYAVGLAISRKFRIGRIYEPLYLCRRWEDNSDAALDIAKTNIYNAYKDRIRTIELLARQQILKKAQV